MVEQKLLIFVIIELFCDLLLLRGEKNKDISAPSKVNAKFETGDKLNRWFLASTRRLRNFLLCISTLTT